jgi:spore germination cell wall hydrolase CwlJ-like protein
MHLKIAAIIFLTLTPLVPSLAEQARKAEAAVNKAEILEQKASPEGQSSSLRRAPTISRAEARAIDPDGDAPLEDAITCMARSIYWESKGLAREKMEAVASVVMNRLADEAFPNTVCDVVKQGSESGPCQFSWWCDGRPDTVQEEEPYAVAVDVARRALNQQASDTTDGALYFHDNSVKPSWASTFELTKEAGGLLFYRPASD